MTQNHDASAFTILAINPGNTSTKVGLYRIGGEPSAPDVACLREEALVHPDEELARFERISDQLEYRLEAVERFVGERGSELAAVVGRGGLLRPIPGGTYATDESLLEDLVNGYGGHHASNLGGLLASAVAHGIGVPSYVVDPVSVDELRPVARISGLPQIERISLWHALNCKAASREAAARLGESVGELNFIVVHLGSGITVAALERGLAVDVNNAVAEGPFGADRAGGLPATGLVDLAFSGEFEPESLKRTLMGRGGLFAYLGTRDTRRVEELARSGDTRAELLLNAMSYQIGKEIGAMATVLHGDVDAIVLTGGMARSDYIVEAIRRRVWWIGPVMVLPGEDELRALALGAHRALSGFEDVREYPFG